MTRRRTGPPLATTGTFSRDAFARWLERVGVVLPVMGLLALIAVIIQATTTLPFAYTWLRPLDILRDVARAERFPAYLALAVALGLVSRRPLRSWSAISAPPTRRAIWRRVQAGLRAPVTHPRFVRCLGAAGLLYGGALLNDSRYDPIDWLLLAPLAMFLGWSTRGRRRLWRGALELGCVLVAFALASYGFTVLKASLFLGAEPLDHWLMSAETAVFGEPAHRLAYAWAIDHPELVVELDRTYYRLFDHMILVSALLAGAGRHRERIEYMSALAFCYAMGGFTYHVFPAMGPIYRDEAIFAGLRDLPLISNHFHALLARTHAEATAGTLQTLPSYEFIACMPSLHMAHELVMLYYARHSRVAFALSIVFTLVTLLAVLVLGWHYLIDLIGSGGLALAAILVARRVRGRLLPRAAMPHDERRQAR